MPRYYEYDPPVTLLTTDTFIIKQVDASKSATLQDVVDDIVQPLIDAVTISNLRDIGDVTITTPSITNS